MGDFKNRGKDIGTGFKNRGAVLTGGSFTNRGAEDTSGRAFNNRGQAWFGLPFKNRGSTDFGVNLFSYSEQFNNAAWDKLRASIGTDATTAPDGTTTADKLIEDTTASNTHHVAQTYTAKAGQVCTFSLYAKAAERTHVQLQFGGVGQSPQDTGVFNLSTGVAVSGPGASIESVGNGWYRVSIVGTWEATTAVPFIAINNGTTATYNGDGTSGIYIWGAQLEVGTSPTAYKVKE